MPNDFSNQNWRMRFLLSIFFLSSVFLLDGQSVFFKKPDSVCKICQRLGVESDAKTLTGLTDAVRFSRAENLPVTSVRIIELPFRNRFEIKTFNDNWSGGFTEIHDDLRSYGLDLSYVFPTKSLKAIKATARFSGLTYRTGAVNFRQRADELYLKLERPIYFFKKGYGNIRVNLGGYVVGKLTSDKIQNVWHETFGVRQLNLDYKIPTTAFAEIGLAINKSIYRKKLNEQLTFSMNIEATENLAFGYFNHFRVGLPWMLTSSKGDYFSIKTSANFYSFFTDEFLLQEILEAENGFQLGIEGGFGKLFYFYDLFLQKQFSSGGVGLRFPIFSVESTDFKKTDFTFEIGLLTDGNGYFSKFLFPQKKFLPGRFSFALHHSYGTYLKKRLLDYPNQNGHYRQIGVGGDLQFFKTKPGWQINPFVAAAAGIKNFSTYQGDEIAEKKTNNSFFAEADLGLKIKIPTRFLENHCQYGISLFYRTIYQPLSENSQVFERLKEFEKNPQMIGGSVFVGMSF